MRIMNIAALLLAGCAAVEAPNDRGSELARVLQGRVAAETRTCVPITQSRSLTVVDSRTLVYDGGDTVWVNQLQTRCPGLGADGTLIIETSTGQYCRGDKFREIEPLATIPGPVCFLGSFTAYRRQD